VKTPVSLLLLSALTLTSPLAAGQPAPAPAEPDLAAAVRDAMQIDPRGSAEAIRLERERLLDLQLARLVEQRLTEVDTLDGLVVACHEGIVELRGQVGRPELRQRATELALTVSGVQGVSNALRVPGEPAPAPPPVGATLVVPAEEPPPDDVTEPFGFATRDGLAGRGVRVEERDGIVRLVGEVNSESARTYAAVAAQSVDGVRAVRNQLVVVEATQDESRRLAVLIQKQFEYDPLVQSVAPMVLVKVNDGIVRLEGRVHDDSQRQWAADLAAMQVGVFAVDNRLQVDEDLRLLPTRNGALTVIRMH
jgi:osmotically-inducible protein OsmY